MYNFDYGKYEVQARRNSSEEWTTWTIVDDPNDIRKHLNRIEELGFEANVIAPKLTAWEDKYDRGYLLFNPVKPGQYVYSVIHGIGENEPFIEKWKVKAICYDGDKWYAVNDDGIEIEVGSTECMSSKAARRLLKELKEQAETEETEETEVTENDEG